MGGVGDADGGVQAVEEDVVVYGVKSRCKVQEDEEGWGTSVCSHQEIIGDPDQGCFRAVAGAKTRLEFFEQIILFEMVLELGGNCFFYYFGNEWKVRNGPVVGEDVWI